MFIVNYASNDIVVFGCLSEDLEFRKIYIKTTITQKYYYFLEVDRRMT